MKFTEIEVGYIRDSVRNGVAPAVIAKTLGKQVRTINKFIKDNNLTVEPKAEKRSEEVERSARTERKLSQMRSGPATVMSPAAAQQADEHRQRISDQAPRRTMDFIDKPKR